MSEIRRKELLDEMYAEHLASYISGSATVLEEEKEEEHEAGDDYAGTSTSR